MYVYHLNLIIFKTLILTIYNECLRSYICVLYAVNNAYAVSPSDISKKIYYACVQSQDFCLWWVVTLISTFKSGYVNTIKCRYNVVQYGKILHKLLQELRQNINLDPQKTPQTSP